jgi:hypothetical protein
METPYTSRPLDLYLSYNLTTEGIAILHGRHQLAQKSNSTTLPFREDKLMMLSLESGKEISGAACPTFTCAFKVVDKQD